MFTQYMLSGPIWALSWSLTPFASSKSSNSRNGPLPSITNSSAPIGLPGEPSSFFCAMKKPLPTWRPPKIFVWYFSLNSIVTRVFVEWSGMDFLSCPLNSFGLLGHRLDVGEQYGDLGLELLEQGNDNLPHLRVCL